MHLKDRKNYYISIIIICIFELIIYIYSSFACLEKSDLTIFLFFILEEAKKTEKLFKSLFQASFKPQNKDSISLLSNKFAE